MKSYLAFGLVFVLGILGLVGCNHENQPPIAKFEFQPAYPQVNEEVQFDASDSTDPDKGDKISSYKWDFGDGSTDAGEFVTHKYAEAKNYAVKLTVTDAKGATSAEAIQTISVGQGGSNCDLPQDQDFAALAFDGQHLWSGRYADVDEENGKIFKLSTDCKVVTSFKSPGHTPGGIAWDGANLWISDAYFDENDATSVLKLFKVNPSTGDIIGSCKFTGNTDEIDINALAWDGRYLWASETINKKIEKIDVSGNTCQIAGSFKSPSKGDVGGLAWDGQSLWIADIGEEESAKIIKVNPATGKSEASFVAPGEGYPQGLTWDKESESFWVLDVAQKNNRLIKLSLPQ
jgi:PKD repeat protein